MASAHRELTVPCDTSYLIRVRTAVMEVVGEAGFPTAQANMVSLAVDEAVANIMEHAYPRAEGRNCDDPGSLGQDIQIVLEADAARFEVRIRDRGVGFDPRGAADVDLNAHLRSGSKGGLGIFLMRRVMDEINYSFKQGIQNELQMIKYVDGARGAHKSSSCRA